MCPSGKTRVMIVDDHAVMRASLRDLLQREPDLAIWGEASTGAATLELLGNAPPDVVLIDLSLPDMSGIELVQELRHRYPALPVAMLTGHVENNYVDEALKAGVRAYVEKGHGDELPEAIRKVMRGEVYLSAGIAASHRGASP